MILRILLLNQTNQHSYMDFSLTSPYPAPYASRGSLLAGIFIGIFVGGFLLYFRPFGLSGGIYRDAPEKIALFGGISFISYFALEWLLPLLFPSFFRDRDWLVWHRIVYYLLLLLIIATLNGLTINYFQQLDFSWSNYGNIIRQTLVVGILPITMIVLYQYNRKLRQNLQEAAEIRKASGLDVLPKAAPLELASGEILGAEAYGNYVKVYLNTPSGYETEVRRMTLNKFVEAHSATGMLRCHRSYAANPAFVSKVDGNAQGLRLSFGIGDLEIPVSRSFIPSVKAVVA